MILENILLQNLETKTIVQIIFEQEDIVYYVELDRNTCMPKKAEKITVESEIENGLYIQIPDPYQKVINEEALSESQKVKRD